jgi:hypothetical protein
MALVPYGNLPFPYGKRAVTRLALLELYGEKKKSYASLSNSQAMEPSPYAGLKKLYGNEQGGSFVVFLVYDSP